MSATCLHASPTGRSSSKASRRRSARNARGAAADVQAAAGQASRRGDDVVRARPAVGVAGRSARGERRGGAERRKPDWRPGGEHRDPRARFDIPRDEKRRRFAEQAAPRVTRRVRRAAAGDSPETGRRATDRQRSVQTAARTARQRRPEGRRSSRDGAAAGPARMEARQDRRRPAKPLDAAAGEIAGRGRRAQKGNRRPSMAARTSPTGSRSRQAIAGRDSDDRAAAPAIDRTTAERPRAGERPRSDRSPGGDKPRRERQTTRWR